MYILGIDGGGTKTTAIIADENGNVYSQAITGRSNPNTLSEEQFEQVMGDLLHQLRKNNEDIFNRIDVCFAGMAGVGESGRDEMMKTLLLKHLPSNPLVIVQNDAVNALYSGTLGSPGIVQIAGTGAITIGLNENNKMVRVGGWGYLFDDEGSGFYLGNEALRAVFQQYDGRGMDTTLTNIILNYFAVMNVPDLIEKIYGKDHPRSVIAPISQYVVREAELGDHVASSILENACVKMIHSIKTCHSQLVDRNHPTSVILSGGVFTNDAIFIEHFKKLSSETHPNLKFSKTLISPVGGAIAAGVRAVQKNIGPNFVETLNKGVKR
ncbi:N-acetylglucosamine kinase [Ureibacillus acetophenoni]|uniref:N-acetylglucosamine kinase-like BadF-type ATPase n=1 Tax=Ureibacillus acetophenoni TaxID=614649 RepID=A0A285U9W1_9BACL|nr:BadF/BadG/BcrA/BcrD ATPase family protein [Ureibacillus acetophenoni]SOC37091.1 N-acetylglucosamine kinase-like BadF-type ATPase [Ureibacillus acetophenoni]